MGCLFRQKATFANDDCDLTVVHCQRPLRGRGACLLSGWGVRHVLSCSLAVAEMPLMSSHCYLIPDVNKSTCFTTKSIGSGPKNPSTSREMGPVFRRVSPADCLEGANGNNSSCRISTACMYMLFILRMQRRLGKNSVVTAMDRWDS